MQGLRKAYEGENDKAPVGKCKMEKVGGLSVEGKCRKGPLGESGGTNHLKKGV